MVGSGRARSRGVVGRSRYGGLVVGPGTANGKTFYCLANSIVNKCDLNSMPTILDVFLQIGNLRSGLPDDETQHDCNQGK
jgi:hypothetical protein